MKNTQVVLIDLDNTLFDTCSAIEKIGKVSRKPGEYYYHGIGPDFFECHPEVYVQASLIPGSLEFVRNLAQKYEIVYVSARAESARWISLMRLSECGFPEGELILTSDKVKSCRHMNIAFAVDDCPKEIRLYRENGIEVMIPSWDFNEGLYGRFTYKLKEVAYA